MATRTLVVYPDKSVMIHAGAARLVLALLDALDERLPDGSRRTRVDVALSGGSAAQPLGLIATDDSIAALAKSIDWSRVHFWFSDERFVAVDSPDRNAVEARRLLLDGLVAAGSLPEANIHEMPADTRPAAEIEKVTRDADNPDEFVRSAADSENASLVDAAARTYEKELVREMGPEPVFDLMILGMGPDGHYASLFPASSGHAEVQVRDRLTVGVTHSPKMPPLRVSLTAPLIARSRRTWFFAAGAGKAESLAHVFAAGGDVPGGDVPGGDVPGGDVPGGDVPGAVVPKGDGVPLGDVPVGDPEYPSSFAGGVDEFTWFTTEETVTKL